MALKTTQCLGGLYTVVRDSQCDTIEDFIKLANTTDHRRSNIIEASCLLGKKFVDYSEKINNVCRIILQRECNHIKTTLTYHYNYYAKNLTKIEREREDIESSTDTDTEPETNQKNNGGEGASKKGAQIKLKRCAVQKEPREELLQKLILPDNASIDAFYDQSLGSATYYSNLSIRDMLSVLEEPCTRSYSNVDSKINENVGKMRGINKSTYYLACTGSASETHCEDSNLPSINICLFNVDRSKNDAIAKRWTVCNRSKVQECVATASQDYQQPQPTCCQFLDHKDCIVTDKFLMEHNIPYYIIEQYPGDVVYIDCGVYHQVVNINANIAEAINYGSDKWLSINQVFKSCECRQMNNSSNDNTILANTTADAGNSVRCAEIQRIESNDKRLVIVKGTNKPPPHRCPQCDFSTRQIAVYGQHLREEHKLCPFKCNDCNRTFQTPRSLSTHICPHRSDDEKKRFLCQICNKTSRNRLKHIRSKSHKKLAELCGAYESMEGGVDFAKCKKCCKMQRATTLAAHEHKCKGEDLVCVYCDQRFSAKRAYETHRKNCSAPSSSKMK